jgi:spermidine synthase
MTAAVGSSPRCCFLFVGSGCAALIYEVVWFQLLQLVIGSSAVSMGVLLGTFMGGMCLGSYLLPRYIGRGQHPLRVYAFLELGIAVCGLVILVGMPLLNSVYVTVSGGAGIFGIVMRGVVAAICLLPPTILMGATLPAISRWVESTPEGVSWLGFFYGGNIAGGVLGSLLAGFYLLRVFDLATATFVAIALNVIVALVGIFIARLAPVGQTLPSDRDERTAPRVAGAWASTSRSRCPGMTALSSK